MTTMTTAYAGMLPVVFVDLALSLARHQPHIVTDPAAALSPMLLA